MCQKIKVKSKIKMYLKQHSMKFYEDTCDETDQITILYEGYDNSPDKVIESSIYFFSDCMECRIYYDATGTKFCKNSKKKSELLYLLNYINSNVWPCKRVSICGLLYKTTHLYVPRIFMTGDFDIAMGTVVPYDFYELEPYETEDFLTECLPELMNTISPAIFLLLLNEITLSDAETMIKRLFN